MPGRFPLMTRFYRQLFAGRLGFAPTSRFTSEPRLLGSRSTISAPKRRSPCTTIRGSTSSVAIAHCRGTSSDAFSARRQPSACRRPPRHDARRPPSRDRPWSPGGLRPPRRARYSPLARSLLVTKRNVAPGRDFPSIRRVTCSATAAVTDALVFWLLRGVVGLAALPFAAFLFARLPGRGLVLARPLGLLLAGVPALAAREPRRRPVRRAGARSRRSRRWSWQRPRCSARAALAVRAARDLRLWLVGEAVFTVAFFGWTLLRSFSPDVWQTEKPMDMAIVNAINRSECFPPHDPWLAGERRQLLLLRPLPGGAARPGASALDPAVGFNLAVPLFYALTATAVFGVASALFAGRARAGDAPLRSPVLAGLAAAVLAVGARQPRRRRASCSTGHGAVAATTGGRRRA